MFKNRGKLSRATGSPRILNVSRYYIIQYDKNFILAQILVDIFAILLVAISYIWGYKMPFNDPIENIKSNYLNAQIILILVSIFLLILVSFLSKSKEKLLLNLRIVAILSILMILIMLAIKVNLDSIYNETKFEEYYQIYEDEMYKSEKIVTIGLTGAKLSELKQAYIEENIKMYNNFKIKVNLNMVLHLMLVIFNFYLSGRVAKIENKEKRLEKDDNIIYDDEINIKN